MVFLWFSNVSCFGFSLTSWILGPSSCYHLFGASTRIRDKRHNSSCTTGSGAWHPVFTWSWFISWFINPLTIVIFPRKTVVYGIINQLVNNLAAVKKTESQSCVTWPNDRQNQSWNVTRQTSTVTLETATSNNHISPGGEIPKWSLQIRSIEL